MFLLRNNFLPSTVWMRMDVGYNRKRTTNALRNSLYSTHFRLSLFPCKGEGPYQVTYTVSKQ